MNISPINIYSNYNTPSFGVSLKITTNKKVTAKDAAKVLTVPATICLALVTGKSGKTANSQDRSVQIYDNEYFIDQDGHLTQTPANERSDGYYILSKDNKTPIYKLPSGKLMTQQGASVEPAMAVDVLKDEIRKVDKENHTTEEQIENLDSAIKAKKADTNTKVADLRSKTESLTEYHKKLKANYSSLTTISKENLRPICDKFFEITTYTDSWQITSYLVKFDEEKVGKELCRSLASEQAISLLESNERPTKLLDIKELAASQEKKSMGVGTQLDEVTDVNSLLDTLSKKGKTLAKNKTKLSAKEKKVSDTEESCNNSFNSALTKYNEAKADCLDYEENIQWSISETIEDCQDDAQHDYVWLIGYERFKDFTWEEKLYIRDAGNYNMATWRMRSVVDNHCSGEECQGYRERAEEKYKKGARPTTNGIREYIWEQVKDLEGQSEAQREAALFRAYYRQPDGGVCGWTPNPWYHNEKCSGGA